MSEIDQERLSQFRFGVLAPLLCREFLNRQERRAALEEILAKQYRHPNGARISVCERTVRSWLSRYRELGLKGLRDGCGEPRKDKGSCKTLSPDVLRVAEELRREKPSRTVRQIIAMMPSQFASQNLGPLDTKTISERTLSRYLRAKGLTRAKLERGEGYFQRRECIFANEMWQGDTSSGIWLPDPREPEKLKRTKLIAFIDDASRLIAHAEFFFDEQMPSLIDAFTKALLKRGKPGRLLLDNGSNYRSNLMEGVCANLGIELSFCKPRRPQGKGKIERWFRTAKDELYEELGAAGLTTLSQLNERLQAWIEQVYHARIHSELNQTPLTRWQQDEVRIEVLVVDEIRRALMIRQKRKVHENTSTIFLDNEEYQVSPSYAGEMVDVRWHPDLIDRVEIWHDGTFVEIAERINRPAHVERKKSIEEKPTHEPSQVSKLYLQSLVDQNTDNIISTKPTKDYLSTDEFVQVIASGVKRPLKKREVEKLSIFHRSFAPLLREVVETVVSAAVEVKGGDLHTRYVIERLQEKVQQGR